MILFVSCPVRLAANGCTTDKAGNCQKEERSFQMPMLEKTDLVQMSQGGLRVIRANNDPDPFDDEDSW
jgi:hypothetical protein